MIRGQRVGQTIAVQGSSGTRRKRGLKLWDREQEGILTDQGVMGQSLFGYAPKFLNFGISLFHF